MFCEVLKNLPGLYRKEPAEEVKEDIIINQF